MCNFCNDSWGHRTHEINAASNSSWTTKIGLERALIKIRYISDFFFHEDTVKKTSEKTRKALMEVANTSKESEPNRRRSQRRGQRRRKMSCSHIRSSLYSTPTTSLKFQYPIDGAEVWEKYETCKTSLRLESTQRYAFYPDTNSFHWPRHDKSWTVVSVKCIFGYRRAI